MARMAGVSVVLLVVSAWAGPAQLGVSLVEAGDAARLHSEEAAAGSPGFSEEACTAMGETRRKLGVVPATAFVKGCDEVCNKARKIKELWGSGDMAEFACGIVKSFGCVYTGTAPGPDRVSA